MQGVVIKYNEEKGYGFIKDENNMGRFFHISSVKDKELFLENIRAYTYVELYNEECYIIEFSPSVNEKGLIALNINLTDQTLNNKTISDTYKAIVTDCNYNVETFTRIVQGVKKGDLVAFSTAGSNGTYRIGYPEVSRELNLHFSKIDGIGWGMIDVRDLVLSTNNRKNIRKDVVQKLKSQLQDKTIDVFAENDKWKLKDQSILKL